MGGERREGGVCRYREGLTRQPASAEDEVPIGMGQLRAVTSEQGSKEQPNCEQEEGRGTCSLLLLYK